MQTSVQSRNISCLVHFTRLSNLSRILSEGLKPRSVLDEEGQPYLFCDELRIDGHTDAISLSISFPNYKMFYSARCANREDRWVVLLLSPSVLWEKDCAFFKTNAANNQCRHLDINSRKTTEAFLELFEEQTRNVIRDGNSIEVSVRSEFHLPLFYPTDPQAEVLCFRNIENSFVKHIFFQYDTDRFSIKNIPEHITFNTNRKAFDARIDYLAWK